MELLNFVKKEPLGFAYSTSYNLRGITMFLDKVLDLSKCVCPKKNGNIGLKCK